MYLPEEWSADPARRAQAQVPADVVFQTKPQQAIAMLESAWAHGVPMRWVCGDEVYGESTALREVVAGSGRWYVLAVRSIEPIWLARPALEEPPPQLRGRPRTRPRLAEGAPAATTVKVAVSAWPERGWQRLTVAEGEKGPLTYDWAYQRVVESRDQLPGPDGWYEHSKSNQPPRVSR